MAAAGGPVIPDWAQGTIIEKFYKASYRLKRRYLLIRYDPRSKWRMFNDWAPIWVLIVFVATLLFLAMLFLSWTLRWGWFGGVEGINVATTSLTMAGGLVAISYVVLKYRERVSVEVVEKREAEQDADKRILEAAALLSDDKPINQIAGVYALTAIADKFREEYNQRVVDILCAFLRTERGISSAPVESTIMREIKRRLFRTTGGPQGRGVEANNPWTGCEFDFHGGHFFDRFHLENVGFRQRVLLNGAVFHREIKLAGCVFGEGASLDNSIFEDVVKISGIGAPNVGISFAGAEFRRGLLMRNPYRGGKDSRNQWSFEGAKIYISEVAFQPFRIIEANGFPVDEKKFANIMPIAQPWEELVQVETFLVPSGADIAQFATNEERQRYKLPPQSEKDFLF